MSSVENTTMLEALRGIAREKDIPFEAILDALAGALATAYKRMPTAAPEARVTIDPETGEFHVYAQEVDEEGNVTREWEDTPHDFGRIAAQTAKQVILQRIREVEREQKFQEYEGREGDLVTGIVQQADARFMLLDLGKAEALLPQSEQVPGERYENGSRVRAYITEVRRSAKGPQIVVSRTHPELVRRLFELEVPEILDGVVEIKGVAREPGHRTKLAVFSNDSNVDPVGACVGPRGSRVRMVVNELRGEKVDIVHWIQDIHQFVANALSPAKVKEVRIEPDEGVARVIVPDYQLSLAIGKEGQNARLAARLTGLKIDIRSESQQAAESAPPADAGETAAEAESAKPQEAEAESAKPQEAEGETEAESAKPEEAEGEKSEEAEAAAEAESAKPEEAEGETEAEGADAEEAGEAAAEAESAKPEETEAAAEAEGADAEASPEAGEEKSE